MGKVNELGGPEIYTIHQLAELMYDMICEWPHYVKVPFPVAKAIATPRELLLKKVPFPMPTPTIFNLDMIEALSTDTVVSPNALTFEDLGIVPHKLKGYPVEYLIQYRRGGPQYGSTVSAKGVSDLDIHQFLAFEFELRNLQYVCYACFPAAPYDRYHKTYCVSVA